MNPRPQWDSLQALFEGALERAPAERSAFVRAHTDDEEVRREVEALVAAHEQAGGFLMEAALRPGRGDSGPVNQPRLPPGRRLGAFEIVGMLGSGGMGEVYRARDTRLDRSVAIKVLSPAIHGAHGGRERFEREARVISRLSHPHICTIYDVGAAHLDGQETPFLVLELLEGETLATRLTRGPLSIPDAVSYAVEMADALAAAHDSNAHGNYDIYVVSAGGGTPRPLTSHPTDDHVPSFSRDGKFVYFSSRRSGAYEIWRVPVSGGEAVPVTHNGGYVAFESFDGRHVYYTQTSQGPSTLWRIPTAGGNPTPVVEGVSERAFEVLAQGIYYIERLGAGAKDWGFLSGNDPLGPDDRARLRFFEFASSKNTPLAELGERIRYGLAVSPNGRTIVFTRLDSPSSDLMLVENFR